MALLSVVFALAAAFFWAWSALINIPVLKSGYGSLITEMRDGTVVVGEAPFYAALKKIARLNSVAAICAFLSAVAQAVMLYKPAN